MPPRSRTTRPGWIDWANCPGREILINDLQSGHLPVHEHELSAEEAWDLVYQHMAEFVTVVFSQFEARLRDHRRQVRKNISRAISESESLAHDRLLFPRSNVNQRGEPVFDLSPAKLLLRADVAAGLHTRMTPTELQNSRPVEYGPFNAKKFKHRIYQEVRRQKFINYLNYKREAGAAVAP
jgi:hypothetical protein